MFKSGLDVVFNIARALLQMSSGETFTHEGEAGVPQRTAAAEHK